MSTGELKMDLKVLLTGSGGREHALAWKLAASKRVQQIFVAPGNAGTASEDKISNLDVDVMDFAAQIEFARREKIDLVIIGPEAPLVAGVVDQFEQAGIACFGPGKAAAQLEGSKTFTKNFLKKYQIPTARYGSFEDVDLAIEFTKNMSLPMVIKADGLAAGKGVVIVHSLDEAEFIIRDMLSGHAFGEAGARVVIEEFLEGEEASFIVIADGEHYLPFASSQDHKAAFDGDMGPNTGGMGAYSPAPVVTDEISRKIMEEIITPTLSGMRDLGHPYTGFLYAGLMIDADGNPKVIEFNCRFGDPETQPIMMRLKSDLAELCLAALDGNLAATKIEFTDEVALTVVVAAGGYPGDYAEGDVITGLDQTAPGKIFHAGTTLDRGEVRSRGGRVLGVTGTGKTVALARAAAYDLIEGISFSKMQYRTDIGYRALVREDAL